MARKIMWGMDDYPFTILVCCPHHDRLGDLGLIEHKLDFEQNVHAFGDWSAWYDLKPPSGRAFVGFKTAEDATMASLLLEIAIPAS